jgi:septum site-determining protein MinC
MSDKEPVSFKVTRLGTIVSISEEGPFGDNLVALKEKIVSNGRFFQGSPLSLDLGWRELMPEDLVLLSALLKDQRVQLQGIISSSLATRKLAESQGIKAIIGRLGLSEHYSRKARTEDAAEAEKPAAPQEETLMIRKTLRAGQKILSRGNVVIQGDVNPGSEIIADGDIIVLGALRGIAHAGASGREAAAVIALVFEPMQLRIAHYITITGSTKSRRKQGAVIARVEDGKIALRSCSGS